MDKPSTLLVSYLNFDCSFSGMCCIHLNLSLTMQPSSFSWLEVLILCSLACMFTMLLLIRRAAWYRLSTYFTKPITFQFGTPLCSMRQTDKKKGGGRRQQDRRQECLTCSRIWRGQNGQSPQLLVCSFLTTTLCLRGKGRQIVLVRCVLMLP